MVIGYLKESKTGKQPDKQKNRSKRLPPGKAIR